MFAAGGKPCGKLCVSITCTEIIRKSTQKECRLNLWKDGGAYVLYHDVKSCIGL